MDIPVGCAVHFLGKRNQRLRGQDLPVTVSTENKCLGEYGHLVKRFLQAPFDEDPGGIGGDLDSGADLEAGY